MPTKKLTTDITPINENINKINIATSAMDKGLTQLPNLIQPTSGTPVTNPQPQVSLGGKWGGMSGNAVPQIGSPTDVAPTPAPYKMQSTPTPEGYYSRGGAGYDLLNPQTPTQTPEQIQAEQRRQAQSEIDNVNKYYDSLVASQGAVNEGRTRGTNALSTLTGLAGSSEANVSAGETSKLNARDIAKINQERAVNIDSVLSKQRSNALAEAQQARTNAIQDSATQLADKTRVATEARDGLKTLAQSGVTLEGLKTSDPISFKHFADIFGGEEQVKAQMILNRPKQDVVGSPQRVGDHFVQMYKNPITGMITAENIPIPGGLPSNYTKFEKLGDNLVAIPENWNGDTSTLKTIFGQSNVSGGVGNVDPKIIAKIQSSPESKAIVGSLPAIQALKAYKDAVDKWGSVENWSGQGSGELSGTYGNALTAWKSLAGLGALSGADFALAENAVPEPGLFTRSGTVKSKIQTSIDNAIRQAENLTNRLVKNYPQAKELLNSQLNDIKGVPQPNIDAEKFKNQLHSGEILVKDNNGNIGAIPENEFNSNTYTKI